MRSFIDKSLFDEQCMIAERGWGVTNYEDYCTRITDDYLIYRSPILAFDVITYRSPSSHNESKDNSTTTTAAIGGHKILDVHKQYRLLSAGITFRLNETFMQVKTIIKNFIDSYDSIAYSSNVEKVETYDTNASTIKQKSIADLAGATEKHHSSLEHLQRDGRSLASTTVSDGSPKLHPPLVEDYDALMQGVPLCKYKIDLKRIRVEMYAKTEPERTASSYRQTKRLPATIKNALPFLSLNFDEVEGTLSTPLNPDKLVHTTCQLPDKPNELLNACYDNYAISVKDFSLGLMSPSKDTYIRLVVIPKLHLSYGTLLQPHHWKTDEVPIKKLDVQCDQIKGDFSKRELFAFLYLYRSLWSYQPQDLFKVSAILNHHFELADTISLCCIFNKLNVKNRLYHTFDIWNCSLGAITADVVLDRKSVQVQRCNVLSTIAKMHNNQSKWLEVQIQCPCLSSESISNQSKSTRKENKDQINMAIGVWVEKFHMIGDKNLFDFLSFVCSEDGRFVRGLYLHIIYID